jgi:hypothetical protein
VSPTAVVKTVPYSFHTVVRDGILNPGNESVDVPEIAITIVVDTLPVPTLAGISGQK